LCFNRPERAKALSSYGLFAFAPAGRFLFVAINIQGVALNYWLVGLSGRLSSMIRSLF
jgi:hypothetical protein